MAQLVGRWPTTTKTADGRKMHFCLLMLHSVSISVTIRCVMKIL